MDIKLFLDDVRFPEVVQWMGDDNYVYQEPGWIIVRNYKEFINYIENNNLPTLIAFDHDLEYQLIDKEDERIKSFNGEIALVGTKLEKDQPNGLQCAKWLVEYCKISKQKLPIFICHSLNPMGKVDILSYLTNAKKHLNL